MIQALKKWFESLSGDQEASVDQSQEQINLCCFSLMVITANVDSTFDESEHRMIQELGRDLFNLDATTIDEVVSDAKQQANESTSLYEFTSLIHENLSEQDKFKLVVGLWKIAFADGEVDKYEEHVIRRVAELIYLDHARFTEARHIAENQSK
jgi:uncharacterized tellurite resistance protein B-like protein